MWGGGGEVSLRPPHHPLEIANSDKVHNQAVLQNVAEVVESKVVIFEMKVPSMGRGNIVVTESNQRIHRNRRQTNDGQD